MEEGQPRPKQRKGFAVIDKARVHEIASLGGKEVQRRGTGYRFTSATAREAGKRGGWKPGRSRKKHEQAS